MFRMLALLFLGLAIASPYACKRKYDAEKDPRGSTDVRATSNLPDLKGKPDKVSEEPTGLPGYPLACRWLSPPANDTLNSGLSCFISDGKDQALPLTDKAEWTVSVLGNATLSQQVQVDQSVSLGIGGKTKDEIALAIFDMQIRVRWRGQQSSSSGRDLVRAPAKSLRIASSCKTSFTLMLADDAPKLSYIELNRFIGCEKLASSLFNVTVPDPKYRNLPDRHSTVLASCEGGNFKLTIDQAEFKGASTQGPFDSLACQDLSALVNSLAL